MRGGWAAIFFYFDVKTTLFFAVSIAFYILLFLLGRRVYSRAKSVRIRFVLDVPEQFARPFGVLTMVFSALCCLGTVTALVLVLVAGWRLG